MVRFMAGIVVACWVFAFGLIASARAAEQLNIVFILADDLAWSDLGSYGHPWHDTPHLDALAQQGMRFTHGYAPAPICSASRASILTGKTTARLGFEFVVKAQRVHPEIVGHTTLIGPPYTLNLALSEQTIAERLRDLGYRTGFFGKWHVSEHHEGYLGWSPTHGPKAQGFVDAVQDFGSHPYSWGDSTPTPIMTAGEFPVDTMIDRCVEFVKHKREEPFFLMASQFYVHTPVRTHSQWLLDKYEKRVPADVPNRDKRVTYAAFVEEMDHRVGRIVDALDETGLRERTIIAFTSDNGGHPEYAGNAPLRGSKWNLYEGGIRVPLIVRWPGRITAGSTSDTPVIGYDLLPTLVAIAGSESTSTDGVDITPLFDRPTYRFDRPLIWHFPYYHPERKYAEAVEGIGINDFAISKTRPQSAIRRGNHKLLYFYEDDRVELYDVTDDPGESSDLATERSDLADRLRAELFEYLRTVEARLPTAKPDSPSSE